MPELPEVETIVRKLNQVLPGKKILDVTSLHPKTLQGLPASLLLGKTIAKVSRRAKIIRIEFEDDTNPLNVLIHLKMTGQLIYIDPQHKLGGGHPTADWVNELPSKHTRVLFTLSDNAKLFFNDQRLFGWIKIMTNDEVEETFRALGPDIVDNSVTAKYLRTIFSRRSQPIKQVIMDGSVLSGVGNIYASDALNVAQIYPGKPAKTLGDDEIDRLLQAMKQVIAEGIELGGTTFDGKYVDIDGMAGTYQSVVRVYGREGKTCLQCNGLIVKTQLGGRGTYYCSVCQTAE